MTARQSWGFAVQLYSSRSRRSWGIGDLGDLATLATWSAGLGASYILVNPLHAAEPVAPVQPSPYLPSSRRFWNPLYIRVEDVPEYAGLDDEERAGIDALAAELREELAGKDLLDRDASWTAKRAALELLHRAPRSAEREVAYQAFKEAQGESLERFATWNILSIVHGNDYREWPEELRDASGEAAARYAAEHEAELDFEMWLQWVLDEQLEAAQAAAKSAGMTIGIVHDLAVGVHPGGADAWRNRHVYAQGIRVGAPPDAFNQMGQDWQQPPWRPDRLAESGYAPLRDLLRNVLKHAGGVRIDHIIGLFRLWWIPEGASPAAGTYARYDHEAMIGVLAAEAERAGAVVVGEDLGVVEPSAREYLKERGVLGTSILWFERDGDGKVLPAERWRELCLASVTTHDLPPTNGYLDGVHVELRDRLGLLTRPIEEEAEADRKDRESWMQELRGRGLIGEHATNEEIIVALHRYLTFAPSRLLNVALTDAIGDRRTQNQPGTDESQYPNWRIPLSGPDEKPVLLDDVLGSERVAAVARALGSSQGHPLHGPRRSRRTRTSRPGPRRRSPTSCGLNPTSPTTDTPRGSARGPRPGPRRGDLPKNPAMGAPKRDFSASRVGSYARLERMAFVCAREASARSRSYSSEPSGYAATRPSASWCVPQP
ncbi:4-alpha-glucanotransferase [Naasia aerilata]|uniref:4-alpha-glucanotransferase n=1 Tax=Naasia aerilata TaxID=1162966 RepID=A0ABN6XP92_9MICO|nr:4-alpha-glucanotransferase [Naasia aerilata]